MSTEIKKHIPIKLTYTSFFRNGRVLGDLLKRPGFEWVTEARHAKRGSDWLIHQSCNAAFTPFVADIVQQALALIGQDVPVIGGSENCCGEIQYILGDTDLGDMAARKAQQGFSILKPKTLISICPDCDFIFSQKPIAKRTYNNANISSLVVEILPLLKPLMKPIHKRVVFHRHSFTEFARQDASNLKIILEAIPGIVILDTKLSEGPGLHCQTTKPMPPEDQLAMFKEAKRLKADALVVPYHSCYRQHCKMQLSHGVETVHYVALLGESLGLKVHEEFKLLRMLNDVDVVAERLIARLPENKISHDDMRAIVTRSIFC